MDNDKLDSILYTFLDRVNKYQEDNEIDISNEEESLYLWMAIGKFLGIEHILSHMKMVISDDINGIKRVIALIGTPSKDILDKIGDPNILPDELIKKCLYELENKPKQ
jgi:uncharacterized sodium:solute symporter family permease YidK